MWYVYRNYDIHEIKETLHKGVNVWWILLALLAGLLSHISRTLRWQMIIEPLANKTNTLNTFIAVMIGYFANLLIPRMGEISRCGVLARYEKISMSKLIGTVVVERLIDVISLVVCLILVFLLQFNIVSDFLLNNTDLSRFTNLFTSAKTYIIAAAIIGVLFIFRKRFAYSSPYKKVSVLWQKFAEGFMAIKNLKHKGWFIAHTIFIWVMYFIMIYSNFFAFEFTRDLSPLAGLSVFVLGSLGMVAPVQGGMGPWHFMVIASLHMYGVPKIEGGAFALIVWSSLNAMIVVFGIASFLLLPVLNRSKQDADKKMG